MYILGEAHTFALQILLDKQERVLREATAIPPIPMLLCGGTRRFRVLGEAGLAESWQDTLRSIRVLKEMHMQSVLEDSDVHKDPFPIKHTEISSSLPGSASKNVVRPHYALSSASSISAYDLQAEPSNEDRRQVTGVFL